MSAQDINVKIREARLDEFENIGRLNYAVKQEGGDPLYELLYSEVNAEDWLNFKWIQGKKNAAASGQAKVIVAEYPTTGQIVGLAAIPKCNPAHPPKAASSFVPGFNVSEYKKMEAPRLAWKNQMLSVYGGFLFVEPLAVVKEYRGEGIGKRLMEFIIDEGKKQNLNIAVAPVFKTDAIGFYKKLGFVEVAKPFMLADDTVKGPNHMLLEISKPAPTDS
ncbi:hypothetical protein QFC22_006618 [Naganishia vaughanmartiniae]|uniref:Uncharacterized protein n=1 Tax=Naganishia vaughanmartiniae TaxID=1424756 RepID=A0ACC2WHB2_9TREE|nr:hypothetical protein QFC22_006618 [Naganishia vaughanmartiniae]